MSPIKIKVKIRAYTKSSILRYSDVYTNKENIKGNGSVGDPLDLVYTPDEATIIKNKKDKILSAVSLLDKEGNYITPDELKEDISGLQENVDELNKEIKTKATKENLTKIATDLNTLTTDVRDNSSNIEKLRSQQTYLLNNSIGAGGYIEPYKNGPIDESRADEILNSYTLGVLGLDDVAKIPNQTRVKDESNGNTWVFNLRHIEEDDGIDIKAKWINLGNDNIGLATNETAGLVKGSDKDLEAGVDGEGHLVINGLSNKLNSLDQRITSEYDEVNELTGEVSDLQTSNTKLTERVTNVESVAKENTQRIIDNYDDINKIIAGDVHDLEVSIEDTKNKILNGEAGQFENITLDNSSDDSVTDINRNTKPIHIDLAKNKYINVVQTIEGEINNPRTVSFSINDNYTQIQDIKRGSVKQITLGEDNITIRFQGIGNPNEAKVGVISISKNGIEVQGDEFTYNGRPVSTSLQFYIHTINFHNEVAYNGTLYEGGTIKCLSSSSDSLNTFNYRTLAKGFLNGYMYVKNRHDRIDFLSASDGKISVYGENSNDPLGEIFVSEKLNFEDTVEEF